jgi:hypothetical protein
VHEQQRRPVAELAISDADVAERRRRDGDAPLGELEEAMRAPRRRRQIRESSAAKGSAQSPSP